MVYFIKKHIPFCPTSSKSFKAGNVIVILPALTTISEAICGVCDQFEVEYTATGHVFWIS